MTPLNELELHDLYSSKISPAFVNANGITVNRRTSFMFFSEDMDNRWRQLLYWRAQADYRVITAFYLVENQVQCTYSLTFVHDYITCIHICM